MKALIMDSGDELVQVKTEFGSFRGRWMSDMPTNTSYLVELDCNAITNPKHICVSAETQPAIYEDGAYTVLNGFVEEFEDSVMFLRLCNSLMMMEIDCDVDAQGYIGQWAKIRVNGMKIYHYL